MFPYEPWNIPIFEYSRILGRNVPHGPWNIPIFEYSRMSGRNVPTETLKYSDIWTVLQGKPLSIPIGPFRILSKICGEICHRCRWSVVQLDLRISPRIFEKIWSGPNGILWGWGKLIHEKTRSKKSRDTVPLSYVPRDAGIFWEAEYQMLFSALFYYFYQQNE
jgi:hypothetical protein